MADSVDPDQTAPIGAVCTGSILFASILNSPVMMGNYLQQTTSADDIYRCIFLVSTMSYVTRGLVIQHDKKNSLLSCREIVNDLKCWLSGLEFSMPSVIIANREDPDQTASSEAV